MPLSSHAPLIPFAPSILILNLSHWIAYEDQLLQVLKPALASGDVVDVFPHTKFVILK